jgi:DNA topoisomerase IB
VLDFARRLPKLREQVRADLAREGMGRERVLACAVRLLEVGCFRVGGAAYAAENGSYGLATIRKDHVRVSGDAIWFDFDAKSGQHLRRAVVDPDVRDIVSTLRRRRTGPKDELLAYRDPDRGWVDVTAEDINGYLKEHLGEGFSAKDFRTWVGTVLTAVVLADREAPDTETGRRRQVRQAVNEVAEHLGNTPAVARSAYIDPRVVDRYEDDDTIARALRSSDLESIERAVRRLIERAR